MQYGYCIIFITQRDATVGINSSYSDTRDCLYRFRFSQHQQGHKQWINAQIEQRTTDELFTKKAIARVKRFLIAQITGKQFYLAKLTRLNYILYIYHSRIKPSPQCLH